MEETIDAVDLPTSSVDLVAIENEASQNIEKKERAADLLNDAIESAARRPGQEPDHDNQALTGTHNGGYGDTLNGIASTVTRDGVDPATEDELSGIDKVATEFTTLIGDMTNWQITWGIAQSAQKDFNHILKAQ